MATIPFAPLTHSLSPASALPDAGLGGTGIVSRAFLNRGIGTFRAAAAWVHALPYGCQGGSASSLIVFEEEQGNCVTKHGLIARLATELGLDVHKHMGLYRLDDAIAPGVGAVLEPAGLSFVPYMHCFLRHGGATVDLTDGNDTGKTRTPDGFDVVVQVPPESPREELVRLYDEHLGHFGQLERRLTEIPREELRRLVIACSQVMNARIGGGACCG